MKNMLILTLIGATILSCSNDDDNQGDISHQIIGDWKLVEYQFYANEGEGLIDHRHKNIIYSFQANGTLIVSGVSGENDGGTPSGEYPYFFGYDHFWGPGEGSPVLLVDILNLKWNNDARYTYDVRYTYSLTNGIMTLGHSYLDGYDEVFERVKGGE